MKKTFFISKGSTLSRILSVNMATVALCAIFPMVTHAQKIDLDQGGRQTTEVTALGFTSWQPVQLSSGMSESKRVGSATLAIKNTTSGHDVRTGWYKANIQKEKLINDGIHIDGSPRGSNSITLTITGLTNGQHTLQAYHNNVDAMAGLARVAVSVNGRASGSFAQTSRAVSAATSGKSFVSFRGPSVTIVYSCSTDFYINSLELDVADASNQASSPMPADNDLHANADGGSIWLGWRVAANGSEGQKLYWGTDKQTIANGGGTCVNLNQTSHSRQLIGLSPHQTYYWRIDNIRGGQTYQGKVWTFRPRRLAFPGAQGYGRYAIGGRGGVVYHVTNLKDDGSYGSFRYGVTQVKGPRTIVFDVAGAITLTSRLTISDPYITIAGQTAPGRGIMFRSKALGVGSDGITRFIRLRLGGGDLWSGSGVNQNTMDGIGMAGNNNSIMDHCSIGWAIDEGFSSRNARNITLQNTLISEELNYAGHSHYVENGGNYVRHGYAATIGGGIPDGVGSFHHNLLAHNEGRNWSMSGGLIDGAYSGCLDIFNNVCYNWGGRTTDGGAHEVNFVNNYYKMGPASRETYLLTADLEGTGAGTQSYYVNGNIRENLNVTKTTNQTELRRQRATNGQVVNWQVFRDKPFFGSEARIESAEASFRNVLSDVGCNQPELDNHDTRMVRETLYGTYSRTSHYTHEKGLIDRESDAEGFSGLNIITASHPSNWDTDRDGMPDWWEKAYGTNPSLADNNEDLNGDFYTNLEEYLNWLAEPHFIMKGKIQIDLRKYFAGYDHASFHVIYTASGATAGISGSTLTVYNGTSSALFQIKVNAGQDGISLTRTFNFYVEGGVAGQQVIPQPSQPTVLTTTGGTIYWPFDQGTAGQQAALGSDLMGKVITDVVIGSGLVYGGVKELTGLKETRIGVTVDNNPVPDENNKLSFCVTPEVGCELAISKIEFTATRIGTDGGYIDMSWAGQKIVEKLRPARNKMSPEYTTYIYNVPSGDTNKGHKLTFNFYGIGITKQFGLANIRLYGKLTRTSGAKQYVIDFETTGIELTDKILEGDEPWYTLNGMVLPGKPVHRGVYIHQGKKYIIK